MLCIWQKVHLYYWTACSDDLKLELKGTLEWLICVKKSVERKSRLQCPYSLSKGISHESLCDPQVIQLVVAETRQKPRSSVLSPKEPLKAEEERRREIKEIKSIRKTWPAAVGLKIEGAMSKAREGTEFCHQLVI